jgi:Na+/proline symporter
MNQYWFKAYNYGYGWYPASWKGWSVTLIYVLNIFFGVSFFHRHSSSQLETLVSYLPVLILTTILLFVIVVKTGEKARWKSKKV